MQGAALVTLTGTGSDYSPWETWVPRFLAAFDTLVARTAAETLPAAPAALGDLPVIEVPAQPGTAPSDTFAIIMSGDGGWAGLDKEVADALSAHGIPVIGLDSLRYFWGARTAEGLARDTDHMIRYYLAHLGKKRVLLIGYSQGADVLPFAVNRLPAATRRTVALAVLMGMSEHALFEFHVSSWISNDTTGPLTLPEVNRIVGVPVLCIYGDGDRDSLCPKLDPAKIRVVKLPGGHHFNGDYAGLARVILATANNDALDPARVLEDCTRGTVFLRGAHASRGGTGGLGARRRGPRRCDGPDACSQPDDRRRRAHLTGRTARAHRQGASAHGEARGRRAAHRHRFLARLLHRDSMA